MPVLRQSTKMKKRDADATQPINAWSGIMGPASPVNILYLQVSYVQNEDGSLTGGYSYDSISGKYPLGAGIGDFISSVQDGSINSGNQIDPVPASGPVYVGDACYIVFAIDDDGDASFQTGTGTNAGVTTDDQNANEYFNLFQVADESDGNCYIAYFRAISPSKNGQLTPPKSDFFNLNLQANGKDYTIDPEIQNTGHHGQGGTGGI